MPNHRSCLPGLATVLGILVIVWAPAARADDAAPATASAPTTVSAASDSPRFGLGIAFAGPSLAVGIGLSFIPTDWLVIEAGGLPASFTAIYGGFRLRPVGSGALRPFTGAFLSHATGTHVEGTTPLFVGGGGRLGLDYAANQHLVVTVEADLVFTITDEGMNAPFATDHPALWGGASLAWLF
jgi:hypothetical protein